MFTREDLLDLHGLVLAKLTKQRLYDKKSNHICDYTKRLEKLEYKLKDLIINNK